MLFPYRCNYRSYVSNFRSQICRLWIPVCRLVGSWSSVSLHQRFVRSLSCGHFATWLCPFSIVNPVSVSHLDKIDWGKDFGNTFPNRQIGVFHASCWCCLRAHLPENEG